MLTFPPVVRGREFCLLRPAAVITFASDGDTGIGNCWHDTEIIERIWTGKDKQGKEGEAEADASLIARGAEETARRACRTHTMSVESAAGPGQRIRTGRRTACST